MSTRKIKNAKDLDTGELVYFKGHAQATFMSDGLNVEETISNLANSQTSSKVELLNSISEKQDTLVSGTNIKTINGESILGEGDLTIKGGAKVYTWNWDGSESGTLTQEEYDGIVGADIVYVTLFGTPYPVLPIIVSDVCSLIIDLASAQSNDASVLVQNYLFYITNDKIYNMEARGVWTPTKTSQLENDSHFVSSYGLKTINGESIVGSGDITISGGASMQPMVATTWSELKAMRDNSSLVAGTWYRITDYVTTTSQANTISAGYPFDVVVLATGENTLSEEARAVRHEGEQVTTLTVEGVPYNFIPRGTLIVDDVEWFKFEAIEDSSDVVVSSSSNPVVGDMLYPYYDGAIDTSQALPIASVDETEDEYFLNNKVNLDAWKIWYYLDNDKARFSWAVAKTKKSIAVSLDEATLLTCEYNGTYEYEGVMYYRWDAVYSGMSISFLTVSDNPKAGDTTSVYGIIEQNIFFPYPMTIMSVNEPSENEGFGVIYRMIDERGNDCPYDFKNIQFLVPITGGQFDENGTEEWVFTFNLNLGDGSASTDYSNTSLCYNNSIKSTILGLNVNTFLNTNSIIGCYNNTLDNNCMYNVFNDSCYNNTLDNNCMYNLFESYTCNCNVASKVQSETINVNGLGSTSGLRVAYNSSNTLKIYCEADVTGDYNDLSNTPTIDTSMSSSSTNAVQNKVIKSYVDSNCNIPVITTTASSQALVANTYYKWSNIPTSITITLTTPTNTNILNNYMFEFTANSSGCTLSVPSSIKWLNEIPPVIEPGKTYQISIINNLATVAKFG